MAYRGAVMVFVYDSCFVVVSGPTTYDHAEDEGAEEITGDQDLGAAIHKMLDEEAAADRAGKAKGDARTS